MLRRLFPRTLLFRVPPPILPLTSRKDILPALHSFPTASSSVSTPFRMSSRRLTSPVPSSRPPEDGSAALPPNATFSQRLKYLIKSYGWYAAGVYFVLSALDFTVAFVGISLLGADQVAHATTYVKETILEILQTRPPEPSSGEVERVEVERGQEGLYAMIVLAYTIHKTLFLPVRIGLTATLTPRLVGWLRARGWAGGEGTMRAAQEMRSRLRRRKADE